MTGDSVGRFKSLVSKSVAQAAAEADSGIVCDLCQQHANESKKYVFVRKYKHISSYIDHVRSYHKSQLTKAEEVKGVSELPEPPNVPNEV